MVEQEQPTLESWDDFVDTWLKAKHLKQFPERVTVESVKASLNRKGEPQLVASVKYLGNKYLWDINKTNMKKLRNLGISKPANIKGIVITLNKIKVRNPRTGETVDGLEVEKI